MHELIAGIVAWYILAGSCKQILQKGSAVLVDGELQSQTWMNEDGSSKNVVENKARRIQFLNKRKNDESSGEEASDSIDLYDHAGFHYDQQDMKFWKLPSQKG